MYGHVIAGIATMTTNAWNVRKGTRHTYTRNSKQHHANVQTARRVLINFAKMHRELKRCNQKQKKRKITRSKEFRGLMQGKKK